MILRKVAPRALVLDVPRAELLGQRRLGWRGAGARIRLAVGIGAAALRGVGHGAGAGRAAVVAAFVEPEAGVALAAWVVVDRAAEGRLRAFVVARNGQGEASMGVDICRRAGRGERQQRQPKVGALRHRARTDRHASRARARARALSGRECYARGEAPD